MLNGGQKAMFSYKSWHPLKLMLILTIPILINGCGGNDPKNSKQLYKQCVSCHSMAPGRQLSGPSLSDIWGRNAGRVEGFTRYSNALKASNVVWTDETMDAWLKDPQDLIPGNQMMFDGISDPQVREELLTKLKMKITRPYE